MFTLLIAYLFLSFFYFNFFYWNCRIAEDLVTVKRNPNASHWNIENGFEFSLNGSSSYPYRVFGSSSRDILNVILGIEVDDSNKFCNELAHGFRVSLHSPDELPRVPDKFIFVPIEHDVYISVKPNMIATSIGLYRYPSEVRGCFFKTERRLRFFKSYNQPNCEFECLANATRDACGCVKFSMPSKRFILTVSFFYWAN